MCQKCEQIKRIERTYIDHVRAREWDQAYSALVALSIMVVPGNRQLEITYERLVQDFLETKAYVMYADALEAEEDQILRFKMDMRILHQPTALN